MAVLREEATYRVLIKQRDEAWEKLATAETVIASFEDTIRDLRAKLERAAHLAIEEHEAKLCPEDVGCERLIASLRASLAAAEAREARARALVEKHGLTGYTVARVHKEQKP